MKVEDGEAGGDVAMDAKRRRVGVGVLLLEARGR